MRVIALALAVLASAGSAAAAQPADIELPPASIGTDAILAGDFKTAEREIRASRISKYDPARALNLGMVLSKTGRTEQAIKQFNRVLLEDRIDLVLANGKTISSHEAARTALANIAR